MKVLMINSVCGIRSTGRICTDLADALTEQGHEVRIAYGRECVPEKYRKYAVRIGNDFEVNLHAIKTRLVDESGFGSKPSTVRFIEWVKEYDPDVIHLHNLHGYYINIEILFNYLKTYKKRIIWTLHDCWAFTGHCSHFDYVKCDRWKKGCYNCPQKSEYPKSYLFDKSSLNWHMKKVLFSNIENMLIVTPSQWLANLVKESFLGCYPVKVINNGIDTNIFKPTYGNFRDRYQLMNRIIILGVASDWSKRKGFFDFIKLSELLDERYKVVLVGLSKKQMRIIPSTILGITRTNSKQELAEIYTAADLFLNLTYEDTYPTVNIESVACGTPVVTYRTGGSPENSYTPSCVIEQHDFESLKRLIIDCSYENTLKISNVDLLSKECMNKRYQAVYFLDNVV